MLLNINYRTLAAVPPKIFKITQTQIKVVFVDASTIHTSMDTFFES